MKAVSILGLAAVLVSTGAAAEPQPMRSVPFSDLNLQTPAGVAVLEQRIARAAEALCAFNVAPPSVWLDEARDQCVADTIAGTQSGIELAIRTQRQQMTQSARTR